MGELLQFFQAYGFPGLVAALMFIWNFKLQERIEKINTKVVEIVETNTKAMIELKETIRDIKVPK